MKPLLHTDIQTLREYIGRHGVQHDGEWYFDTAWLSGRVRKRLEDGKIINRVGFYADLKGLGVPIEKTTFGHARRVYYKVNGEMKFD